MFKKVLLFLTAACIVTFLPDASGDTSAPARQQPAAASSDQTAAARTIFVAILNADTVTLEQLLDPEFVKMLQAEGLTKHDFLWRCKIVPGKMSKQMQLPPEDTVKFALALYDGNAQVIWDLMQEDEKKALIEKYGNTENAMKIVAQHLPEEKNAIAGELQKNMVLRNGRWYFTPDKPQDVIRKIKDFKNTVAKQSSKEETAESFFRAVADGNIYLFWQLCSPENKQMSIAATGSESKALEELAANLIADDDVKAALENPEQKKLLLQHAVQTADRNEAWVHIDGKWYLDFRAFAKQSK